MNYNYSQKRHIELLKRSQDLKNQGKSLFLENREEDFELCKCNVAVERHLFLEDRYQVALSMEDFLNRKIDGEELCDRVYEFRSKLSDAVKKFQLELICGSEKIKDFQPDERSKNLNGSNGILTFLFCECDNFMEDYENEEFYASIKNKFLYFQKALNEEQNLF